MLGLIENFLSDFIKEGALEFAFANGKVVRFGDRGVADPPRVALRDRKAEWELLRRPELAFGELYMNGRADVVHGTLDEVLGTVSRNAMRNDAPAWLRLLFKTRIALRALHQRNDPNRARRNVAHHYDIGNDLYSLFLDEDQQYSCAYFENDAQTLEEAQLAKRRHIAAKLFVEPGQSVLDIGCGWGGLGLYLARTAGANVTGVTFSQEQLAVANQRAAEAGLSNHARFELQDYRHVRGKFDRIVSVGMFEHVGVNYFKQFFEKIAASLERRWHRAPAYDRAHRRPRGDQPLGRQIHFSRWLHTGPFRNRPPYRAGRPHDSRYRSAAPALCQNFAGLGGSVSARTARKPRRCTTSGSAGCGNSISPALDSPSSTSIMSSGRYSSPKISMRLPTYHARLYRRARKRAARTRKSGGRPAAGRAMSSLADVNFQDERDRCSKTPISTSRRLSPMSISWRLTRHSWTREEVRS